MAPGNRRGGKHAVKDKDLTHTKYDDYNREQLVAAVKEAGCYVKDEKKSAMARRLADRDQISRLEEHRAKQEQKDREKKKEQEIKEAAKAKRSRRRAREQRNEDRYERRELGEDVSSDSEHTEDLEERGRYDAHKLTVTGGEVLGDDTWEDTCSEISVHSRNPPIAPSCRLRLYEWAYPFAPSPRMPANFCSELFPAPLTYVPLRLTTMFTGEKVTLPGLKYPAGVDSDFVPILDPLVRVAARHGHTTGLLAHATIERASTWATRTIVHGWNGRMYLSLPPKNPKDTQLDEVYHKLNTERLKLLQPTPGATDAKKDRSVRLAQRSAGKRRAIAEVYDASQWQPLALGFMPAQLDWEPEMKDTYLRNAEFTIDNLFYVRFPGCDLPHYCFWTRPGEWVDPTTPDPSWSVELGECQDSVEKVSSPRGSLRARNLTAPAVQNSLTESDPAAVLSSIERALIAEGLAAVLAECRAAAIASGIGEMWRVFTAQLPMLYPSSTIPHAPPMEPTQGVCVAEKITALLCDQDVLPLTGQESWTRLDNDYWELASSHKTHQLDPLSPQHPPHHHTDIITETQEEDTPQALYRRNSGNTPPTTSPSPKHQRILTWLNELSHTNPPRLTPTTPLLSTPLSSIPISPLDLANNIVPPTCPFCNTSWRWFSEPDRAAHMLSHSHISPPPVAEVSRIDGVGVGAKRRFSMLSINTLTSYHVNAGNGRKALRIGVAAGLVEGARKVGSEPSPYTREIRKVRRRKGWLGRVSGRGGGEARDGEGEGWFGDDERGC